MLPSLAFHSRIVGLHSAFAAYRSQRFATLAKYLPFLPVFGGGTSLFQPVRSLRVTRLFPITSSELTCPVLLVQIYAGDLARTIEVISRSSTDPEVAKMVDGKVIEAGGPTGESSTAISSLSKCVRSD